MVKLTLPANTLSTTLRQLSTERERPRRRAPEIREQLGSLLEEATVSAVLQFAPMRLGARALMSLSAGSILRMPLPVHAAAQLCCNGVAFAQARPVQVEEHRGAQLLPEALGTASGYMSTATEGAA
jgi:flagellar motor switch protein FliM